MFHFSRIVLVTSAFLLGCSEPVEVSKTPAPLVVQLSQVQQSQSQRSYQFPAKVSAVKTVEIKFEVTGRLINTQLVKGSEVKKGAILAEIDPAPYQRLVDQYKVRYTTAGNELRRVQSMFDKGVASQSVLDTALSEYQIAELALDNAEQDLGYCVVRAPFDAVIATRYIDNNSYIKSGDSLATLQDRSSLYFTFDVPERLMTMNAGKTDIKATAQVLGFEDSPYDIHYVEHETTPDPITQTYNVTFAIDNIKNSRFAPGSRATVTIYTEDDGNQNIEVPLTAISGHKSSGFYVWLFNEETNTVNKQKVNVILISNNTATINSGISAGDKIVSAAVNQMRDNLSVVEFMAEK